MNTICGINAVYEALRAGRRKVLAVYIAEGRKEAAVEKIVSLATKNSVQIRSVPRRGIFELTRVETNQGVAAEVEPFRYISIEELIKLSKNSGEPAFIIILDQVNDPHNFGAIIRTAHLLGVHGMIIPKDNSVDVTPTVAKAASGAVEYMPVARVTNLNSAIKILKENNIWVVGSDGDAEKTIYEYDFKSSVTIVLGGEGKGLRRLVKENCDELLTIPMKGKIDSFNVSVAGAIIAAEVVRQRTTGHGATTGSPLARG